MLWLFVLIEVSPILDIFPANFARVLLEDRNTERKKISKFKQQIE